jgi:hypothetical protein
MPTSINRRCAKHPVARDIASGYSLLVDTFSVVAEALNLPTSVVFTKDTLIVTLNGEVWKVPRGSDRDHGKGVDCLDNDRGNRGEGE